MSDALRREIAVERQLLNRLLDSHRELRQRSAQTEPGPVEISALAAMLHSFYTGIENVMKRIALRIDGGLPEGPAWHTRLLDRLRTYMAFRHMFRHTYSFELRWDHMKPLVSECQDILRQFEEQVEKFLHDLPE